jgi:hypothetical protein
MNIIATLRSLSAVLAQAVLALAVMLPAVPAVAQTRPALVRDVDNGALQPLRTLINVSLAANETFKTVNGPVVPAGKRLVVENVSVWILTQGTDSATGIWLTAPTASPPTYALMDPASTERKNVGGTDFVTAYNRVVKLYFDPGETVQAQVFFLGTSGIKIANLYLNGYYVNLP